MPFRLPFRPHSRSPSTWALLLVALSAWVVISLDAGGPSLQRGIEIPAADAPATPSAVPDGSEVPGPAV